MATGEWLSAPKGDFEQDTTLRVVEENGRHSFFRQELPSSEQKDKEAQDPVFGAFAENIIGDELDNQMSSHGKNTLAGVRTSKGDSTAETTQSDSSQDTSPQKCEAPQPEASQPENKGTLYPILDNYLTKSLTGSRWIAPSDVPEAFVHVINMLVYLFYTHEWSYIPETPKCIRHWMTITGCKS